jgi:hypothetical protein
MAKIAAAALRKREAIIDGKMDKGNSIPMQKMNFVSSSF